MLLIKANHFFIGGGERHYIVLWESLINFKILYYDIWQKQDVLEKVKGKVNERVGGGANSRSTAQSRSRDNDYIGYKEK